MRPTGLVLMRLVYAHEALCIARISRRQMDEIDAEFGQKLYGILNKSLLLIICVRTLSYTLFSHKR